MGWGAAGSGNVGTGGAASRSASAVVPAVRVFGSSTGGGDGVGQPAGLTTSRRSDAASCRLPAEVEGGRPGPLVADALWRLGYSLSPPDMGEKRGMHSSHDGREVRMSLRFFYQLFSKAIST